MKKVIATTTGVAIGGQILNALQNKINSQGPMLPRAPQPQPPMSDPEREARAHTRPPVNIG